MSFFKVSLLSNEILPLKEKKRYIDSMYRGQNVYTPNAKVNQGFATKFNNSIGFKPVIRMVVEGNRVIGPEVESPEDYIAPDDILLENIQTPLHSNDILHFYIESKEFKHPVPKFSYKTKDIANKWAKFLSKIFPELIVKVEEISEIPKLSLKDFALQYFYRNLEENICYTIEFSSEKLLENNEIKEILDSISSLSSDKITIAQHKCSTCSSHTNGEKPYHIEIAYLTYYGRDEEEKTYKEYGDSIYKIS